MWTSDNTRGHTVSDNKTLFFAEGATSSSGAPVTITSSNDNAYTGDQTLTVTGTITPPDDDMTVKSVDLTVTDNDVAYGKIRLVLDPSRIDESDADTDADVTTAESRVTAMLVGGATFDENVVIAVFATND